VHQNKSPVIEGDRFINFRGTEEDQDDIAQKFETKIELYSFD